MRPRWMLIAALMTTTMLGASVTGAHAQRQVLVGGYLTGAFPTGDWGQVAGAGFGGENATIMYLNPGKGLAIRSGSSLIFNFARDADVPSSNLGPNTQLYTETSNTSLWLGIGPELGKTTGDMRPFVYGTIGWQVNWMNSHLKGTVQGGNYDSNVGHSDTGFAWTAGAGLRKAMAGAPGGRIELSAEYRSGVNFTYVVPDEVTSSGSSVYWNRTTHNTDQIIVRIGTVFGN